jgi:hypothetical protein
VKAVGMVTGKGLEKGICLCAKQGCLTLAQIKPCNWLESFHVFVFDSSNFNEFSFLCNAASRLVSMTDQS